MKKKTFLNAAKSLNNKSQITVKYTYRKYPFQLAEGPKTSILYKKSLGTLQEHEGFGLYLFVVTPNVCHETFKLMNNWSAVSSFAFADQLAFETNRS